MAFAIFRCGSTTTASSIWSKPKPVTAAARFPTWLPSRRFRAEFANAVLSRSVTYHAVLRTTCIPTLIDGGHAPNAQPQRVRVTVNCRTLPGASIEALKAAIVTAVDNPQVKVSVTVPAPRPLGPVLTPTVMDPIRTVAAQVYPGVPVTPMQETFGTDAGFLNAVGIPTYGFSALFRGDDAGNIHGLNEHISIQSVMDGRAFMYRLIKLYADQK